VSLRAKKSRAIEGRKLTALFLVEKHSPVCNSEEGGLSARVGLDSECDEETLTLVGRRGIEIETEDAVQWHIRINIVNMLFKMLFSSIYN
jgi:hypothetical protein